MHMKKIATIAASLLVMMVFFAGGAKAQSTTKGGSATQATTLATATYRIAMDGLTDQKATWLKELEKEDVIESISTDVATGVVSITVFHPETMDQDRVKATLINHIDFRSKGGTK